MQGALILHYLARMKPDTVLTQLRRFRGATQTIADKCGVTQSAVSQWRDIPQKHWPAVAEVAKQYGIKVEGVRA